MTEYTLRNFIDFRSLLVGGLIVFTVTAMTFTVGPFIFDDDKSIHFNGEWNISSGNHISQSMGTHVESLLYTWISVSTVTSTGNTWNIDPKPIFIGNIFSLALAKDIGEISGEQPITPTDDIWNNKPWNIIYSKSLALSISQSINGSLNNKLLMSSLSLDLDLFGTMENVTDNLNSELTFAKGIPAITHWFIEQVYSDGTAIRIQAFGELIFVQLFEVAEMVPTQGSYIVVANQDQITKPAFKTEISGNPFASYENAINDMLSSLLGIN